MPSRRANQAERPDKTIAAAVNTGIETSENKALPWAHYRSVTLPVCKHTYRSDINHGEGERMGEILIWLCIIPIIKMLIFIAELDGMKIHTYFCVPGTQQVRDKYCKSELKSWTRLFPVCSSLSTVIWPPRQRGAMFLTPELKHILVITRTEGIMDIPNILIHLNLHVWLRDPRS